MVDSTQSPVCRECTWRTLCTRRGAAGLDGPPTRRRTMIFRALACDYDGTLATHDRIGESTVGALRRARDAGLKLVLVTGRVFFELIRVCEHLDLFDIVVAENGGVLHFPGSGSISSPLGRRRAVGAPGRSPCVSHRLQRAVADAQIAWHGRRLRAGIPTVEPLRRRRIHGGGLPCRRRSRAGEDRPRA